MKPFTFSNGVTVPAGTMIAGNMWAIHRDPANFDHADEFDGFRWIRDDDKSSENGSKSEKDGNSWRDDGHYNCTSKGHASKMVTTTRTYLPFGTGKLAWSVSLISTLL